MINLSAGYKKLKDGCICLSCCGCGKLELPDFQGEDECRNYMKGRKIAEDYISEIHQKLMRGEQQKI